MKLSICDVTRLPAPAGSIVFLLLLLLSWPLVVQGAQDRPNILILMAEDMSSRVGAFGDEVASTPNLDRLAESGVRFPNTFTTAGVCAPSRAAHITGMHQISIGAQHMRASSHPDGPYLAVPPPEVKAYPELLRQAGYYTLTNHKLDYQFSVYGAGSGPFTIWDQEGESPDWGQRAEGQPFFALINFGMTHESRMFAKNVAEQRARGWKQVSDPADVEVPPYYPDTPVIRQDIAQHYDNIHEMDRVVGQWLQRLEADGLAEDTIVIWTTDHGDGLPRGKRELYDSGIRVPLIIRWPVNFRPEGVSSGSVDERLLSFIDFAPSVLSWAGVESPQWIQGRPILSDPDEKREFVFASKDRLDEVPFRERVVRDDRFKYLYNYRPGEPGGKTLKYREQLATMRELHEWFDSGRMNAQQAFWFEPRPAEELYDLDADPHEVNNLAADPAFAAELERMRTALAAWRERVPDLSDRPDAVMAQVFWPEGKQPKTAPPIIQIKDGTVSLQNATPGASIGYRLADGEWKLYTAAFDAAGSPTIEAKAVRYGWMESEIAAAALAPPELVPVALNDPLIRVEGVLHVEKSPAVMRFSRFPPELLTLDKSQIGFNSSKAENASGGLIAFRSASSVVRLEFRPLDVMNRGSEFGVFADGALLTSHRFGRDETVMAFELNNPGAGAVSWEISLPSFAGVELSRLELDKAHGLLEPGPAPRQVYAALGDSITHGTGQGSASHLSWPFLLSRKLDYELYNLAVGGSGVSIAAAETLASLERVDVVTILFGYNDWNGEGDSVEAFTSQYRQMLSEVRAAQPGATVFCISPLVTRREQSKSTGQPIDGFRNAVQKLALEWSSIDPKIHFIDGRTISSYENLQPAGSKDVVHLTVEGAAMLADALYPLIEAELR